METPVRVVATGELADAYRTWSCWGHIDWKEFGGTELGPEESRDQQSWHRKSAAC
jgi:hypothetical protein